MTRQEINTPIVAEQFMVGNYRCRYGQALDLNNYQTGEWCVWLWNGHYWQLLIRNCTDLTTAKYSTCQELCEANKGRAAIAKAEGTP